MTIILAPEERDQQKIVDVIRQLDQGLATLAATVAAITGPTTGDLKPTHKTTADTSWIIWSDGTIGDASSSSSIRANADTQALFTLYYDNYSDANCPLLTSAGGATTRGAQGTASAAFAAHCRMTLPKGAGRSLALAGTGSGLTSRTLGETAGAETETPTAAKTFAHNHDPPSPYGGAFLSHNDALALSNFTFSGANSCYDSSPTTVGSSVALNILDPSSYINVMIKL